MFGLPGPVLTTLVWVLAGRWEVEDGDRLLGRKVAGSCHWTAQGKTPRAPLTSSPSPARIREAAAGAAGMPDRFLTRGKKGDGIA